MFLFPFPIQLFSPNFYFEFFVRFIFAPGTDEKKVFRDCFPLPDKGLVNHPWKSIILQRNCFFFTCACVLYVRANLVCYFYVCRVLCLCYVIFVYVCAQCAGIYRLNISNIKIIIRNIKYKKKKNKFVVKNQAQQNYKYINYFIKV